MSGSRTAKMSLDRPRLVVISGATASGKSALALQIARRFNGEIVSADSMQFYRAIPIGTAQPTTQEREEIKHHLVGICDLSQKIDVYRFLESAQNAITEISAGGKLPIIVGGSGMYLKSLLYGLDDLPGDDGLRRELFARYDNDCGEKLLHEKMAKLDPVALDKWQHHRRKLIRALEVMMLSGESLIEQQRNTVSELRYDALHLYLEWPAEMLKERIAARTALMLEQGWIDEARTAVAGGILSSPTAWQAIGYKQIEQYIRGELTADELPGKIATATWQLARKQRTWFRHQHPEAQKISMPCPEEKIFHIVTLYLQQVGR